MDLGKANPRAIATLIVNGKRQLSEVPASNYDAVASCVEDIKREHLERFLRSLESMKVTEVRKIAKQYLSVKSTDKLTKPWLIKEIFKVEEGAINAKGK